MRKLFIFHLLLLLAIGNATAQKRVQRGIARIITGTATDPIVPVTGVHYLITKSDRI